MLGFLYKDHPIIREQNRLHCFAFASPPVVSREFTDNQVGADFITSIALSIDLFTRFSVESIRKMNDRFDKIREYMQEDEGIVDQCLQNVSDEVNGEGGVQGEEGRWKQLIDDLRNLPTPKPHEQLFPLGTVLWFIPKEVMVESDEQRRRNLLEVEDLGDTGILESILNLFIRTLITFMIITVQVLCCVIRITHFIQMECVADNLCFVVVLAKTRWLKLRKKKKYAASDYVLCEASNCRHLFQEFVQDRPESLDAHYPMRYLIACDTKL